MTFSDFILEPSDQTDCAGDAEGARLKFTNVGSDDLRALPFKLCGQSIPDPVYSNTNSMQITLCTGINGRKGFNASYVAIPEQERKFIVFIKTLCRLPSKVTVLFICAICFITNQNQELWILTLIVCIARALGLGGDITIFGQTSQNL